MSNFPLFLAIIFCVVCNHSFAQSLQTNANSSPDHLSFNSSQNIQPFLVELQNRCNVNSNCHYSNASNIHCGRSEIIISTICVSQDESNSDPYCHTQKIIFENNSSNQARSFTYSYDQYSQKYMSGAACIKSGNKFYVELENTNLGNCRICEWNDYFDEDGRYIGSEKGMYASTSFNKKTVPSNKKRIIQKGKLIQRIDISTVAQ